jgi:hypothetical protein
MNGHRSAGAVHIKRLRRSYTCMKIWVSSELPKRFMLQLTSINRRSRGAVQLEASQNFPKLPTSVDHHCRDEDQVSWEQAHAGPITGPHSDHWILVLHPEYGVHSTIFLLFSNQREPARCGCGCLCDLWTVSPHHNNVRRRFDSEMLQVQVVDAS